MGAGRGMGQAGDGIGWGEGGWPVECRGTELRYKEIINITDGSRIGYVGDVVMDLEEGKVLALVVPGRLRLFGLLGREPDAVFPWAAVRRFGADTILVEGGQVRQREGRQRR